MTGLCETGRSNRRSKAAFSDFSGDEVWNVISESLTTVTNLAVKLALRGFSHSQKNFVDKSACDSLLQLGEYLLRCFPNPR